MRHWVDAGGVTGSTSCRHISRMNSICSWIMPCRSYSDADCFPVRRQDVTGPSRAGATWAGEVVDLTVAPACSCNDVTTGLDPATSRGTILTKMTGSGPATMCRLSYRLLNHA